MKTILAASVMLAAGLMSSTAMAGPSHPTDRLVVGLNADIPSSQPGVERDANADTVLQHVVEGLVGYRENLEVAPMLAESWSVSEDGKAYTFKLRPGLTFHNGKPVTSEDVKWSFARYANPDTKWQCTYRYDGTYGPKLESIDTPDPLTVVFHLSRPEGMFITNLASIQCLGGVLSKDSVKADGSWDKPIGTGPYMFKDWQRERHVDLERFKDYKSLPGDSDGYVGGKEADAETIRFLIVPDQAARKNALLAGQIDLFSDFAPADIAEATAAGFAVQHGDGMGWSTLLIQTQDPLLKDERVRRALVHAIDLKQVAAAATFEMGKANPSAVATMSPYHSAVTDEWPAYDPEKAKALLAEAGYKGEPVKIQTNRKYDGMYNNAIAIQAMLMQAGINAELDVLDWATQLDNYVQGKFQLQSFSFSARLDPALSYETFIGDKKTDPSAQWEDPEALKVLIAVMAEKDAAKRQPLFEQLHRMMAAQVPIIGLYNDLLVVAASPKVKGYRNWPAGKDRLWNVWKE